MDAQQSKPDPHEAAAGFDLPGPVVRIGPHGRGLINDTFLVRLGDGGGAVILQRLNRRAFPDPEAVMANLRTLLAHAARAGDSTGLVFPALFLTRTGADLHFDEAGGAWRAMRFLAGTRSHHRPAGPRHAREAGRALGQFHALVRCLDPARLRTIRQGLHHTPHHLARLEAALGEAPTDRLTAEVAAWQAFVEARQAGAGRLEQALEAGRLRPGIVHGDPKLENVLFDVRRNVAVSLIDLDTVQPGALHHDIADCLRSCSHRGGEAGAVGYEPALGEAMLAGYFEAAADAADDLEPADLFEAIRLVPLGLGARFLADHLAGDRYFRVDFPGHNLQRAAAQFRLSADIERQRAAIEDTIKRLRRAPQPRS